jgi:hypothetical protein
VSATFVPVHVMFPPPEAFAALGPLPADASDWPPSRGSAGEAPEDLRDEHDDQHGHRQP